MLRGLKKAKFGKALLLCLAMVVLLASVPLNSAATAFASQDAPEEGEVLGSRFPIKTARVLPNGLPDNGSPARPVPVQIGDEIEYLISFWTEGSWNKPSYDMLFVLDWSASMNAGYGEDIFSQSEKARILAKQAIFGACRKVLRDYPNSRVAIMGLNAAASNKGAPGLANIQVDTHFADASSYMWLVEGAFSDTRIDFGNDDNAMFLRMAREKLMGDTSTLYGGQGGVHQKRVLPRKDKSRVPIIVHISDFEIEDPPLPAGSMDGVWRDDDPSYTQEQRARSFNAQIRAYKKAFPDGIYLAMRTDHFRHYDGGDKKFGGPHWDELLANSIALGNRNWAWTKIGKDNYRNQENAISDMIRLATETPTASALVMDKLPAGLEYVRSEPPAQVVNGEAMWEFGDLPPGKHSVRIIAKVKTAGTFVNSAWIAVNEKDVSQTNSTRHEAKEPAKILKLHLRQLIIDRNRSYIELPAKSYAIVANQDSKANASIPTGTNYGALPFENFIVTVGGNKLLSAKSIVPQYYEYAGFYLTESPPKAGDAPPALKIGEPKLDYSAKTEYWLTLCIRPLAGALYDYSWDFRSNDIGNIHE